MNIIEVKNTDRFYKGIAHPYEKRDALKALFQKHKIIDHTNTEESYKNLKSHETVLEIVNPYRNENLLIGLTDEFTLYYGNWHTHYGATNRITKR